MATLRDPIHGDIWLDEISSAIVNHIAFQRLRYIRQNGLLHFVFPGALHTRFVHSIGTMHLARRLIDQLLAPISWQKMTAKEVASLEYLKTVFSSAALLHDIGHGAFSHSIESIRASDGEPFIGRLKTVARKWNAESLVEAHATFAAPVHGKTLDAILASPADHEAIGMIIIDNMLRDRAVVDAVEARFPGLEFAFHDDVNAMLENLPPKEAFVALLDQVLSAVKKHGPEHLQTLDANGQHANLIAALHGMISGTFDVDRMDYLRRDSHYCGVSYGHIDVDFLMRGLVLFSVGGKLKVLVRESAVHAFEDMLWARYQMFLQVYGHKTNVGLNGVLALVLPQAEADDRFDRPESYEEYLTFTDDYVMSNLFRIAFRGTLKNEPYARALVYRQLPMYLGNSDLADFGYEKEKENLADAVNAATKSKATDAKLPEADIISATHSSSFVKVGKLPSVLTYDRYASKHDIVAFGTRSKMVDEQAVPPSCDFIYFYMSQ